MREWLEQARAVMNGRLGLAVFLGYLILLPVTLLVTDVALLIGAITLAGVSALITFGLAVFAVPVTAFAQGYRHAPDAESSAMGVVWHLTSQRWDVGDGVVLERRRCRLRSCLLRSDRPFAVPRGAVYVFTAYPTEAHMRGNVTRSRARYLYQLDISEVHGQVFRRGIAAAVAGDVRATVSARLSDATMDVPTP
jgi:hypothetical protein